LKGLVRVPHQVRKTDRPTVSKTLARTLTPTVSMGRFSTRIWEMYPGAAVAAKMRPPR
jgi:hypothetical protein